MMTDRAILRLTRYYMHELRNGKSQDDAILIATDKTLEEMRELIKSDQSVDEYTKQQIWLDTLETVRMFSRGIARLPIDTAAIPAATGLQTAIAAADKAEKQDPIKTSDTPQT